MIKQQDDTFHSPSDSEKNENISHNIKSSMTALSKKSKYSTKSKLTKSKLFSSLGKTKTHEKQASIQKDLELGLLQTSLLNLQNFKVAICYKLKGQIDLSVTGFNQILSALEQD